MTLKLKNGPQPTKKWRPKAYIIWFNVLQKVFRLSSSFYPFDIQDVILVIFYDSYYYVNKYGRYTDCNADRSRNINILLTACFETYIVPARQDVIDSFPSETDSAPRSI